MPLKRASLASFVTLWSMRVIEHLSLKFFPRSCIDGWRGTGDNRRAGVHKCLHGRGSRAALTSQ
jgi:hypothetical protein